ncbi:nicotinamide-nucleotide amidase [Rhodovulum sp. ES.010]|uniref:CinA family protein n=1 Tax=Rhodovulum sp. ES.010 TaxID=1882821 RepID=UPI00092AC834|nr:CinA family protein [Rhodovulum sp. ES.010]SIO20802.1 nicotinamide-nucleotide amidase [Rhodovulum sp. ES.010]
MTIRPDTLVALARERGITIAAAESCTGGMLAAAITDIPGASKMFDCGFVTYSNAAKQALLDVRAETLAAHGAVSEAVATEMAQGALDRSAADFAVAITGIAGPGGSDHKPEGRVCFALARRGAEVETEMVDFGRLGRDRVRAASRDHALSMLTEAIGEAE